MCGVCETPELSRGAAGLCARVRECAVVPPNLYIHTYIYKYCVAPRACVRVYARAGAAESLHMLAGGGAPPVCWCPLRCGAPLRAPRGVVCPPVVGACPVCCPPLRWVLAPCAGAPPQCCGPDRDHCYDCLEATAPHRIHLLAPWRHQGSGHPHAYGSCVRRAGTVPAVIHSPQQAFSQQSSGAAASRSRSHSSATNMVAAPVMLP